MRPVLLAVLALLLAAAAPVRQPPPAREPSTAVVMQERPGTVLDATARQLVAQDLGEARQAGEQPLLLVGSASLTARPADPPALFVQLQSARECGSAGCSTTVYMQRSGRWVKVLDSAEGRIAVSSRRTGGMSDLVAENERYVWNGTVYRDTRPAPAVDLRPRGHR